MRFSFVKCVNFYGNVNSRDWEETDNEQLHYFFSSSEVIKFIKFRRMKFAGIK
jgi:hypothetical protein